jgi:acyl phosphate:glycerol-3-phosphate acyltransferase
MVAILALVPVGWLLGTFPSAGLVARAHGRDVTKEGSGNPGTTNILRMLGWRAAVLVFACDAAKGAIATGLGYWVGGRPGAFVLGVAAILGHTFPLYRKGGKGIAVGAGVLIVLYPLIVICLAPVWFLVARLLHKASLASLVVTVAFPVAVFIAGYDTWELIVISALAVLVIARHSSNIRRLLRREEADIASPPTP